MSRKRVSWIIVALVIAAVVAAVWAVSVRTRPAFATYDTPRRDEVAPLPVAPVPPGDSVPMPADSSAAPPRPAGPAAAAARRTRVATPGSDTLPAHPHRSDNYGGYGGYGARERRSDPNAK